MPDAVVTTGVRATQGGPPGEGAGCGPTAEGGVPEVIEDELLVEEISIDGMCGVY